MRLAGAVSRVRSLVFGSMLSHSNILCLTSLLWGYNKFKAGNTPKFSSVHVSVLFSLCPVLSVLPVGFGVFYLFEICERNTCVDYFLIINESFVEFQYCKHVISVLISRLANVITLLLPLKCSIDFS